MESRLVRREFESTFPLFGAASGGLVDEIFLRSAHHGFDRGVTVYSEGDLCSGIGFLLSGEVRVFKVGDSGREITLYRVGPGETCILGASSILSSRPYPASAMTVE
jgi:CRP/FNR family transcriptional regulator